MKPRVISIKNAPAGWEANSHYVYIGRPRKNLNPKMTTFTSHNEEVTFIATGEPGFLGNPIPVGSTPNGQTCPWCGKTYHAASGGTLKCYELYLGWRVQADPKFCEAVKALWSKTLVCFCKPNPCHGDILAEMCEQLQSTLEEN